MLAKPVNTIILKEERASHCCKNKTTNSALFPLAKQGLLFCSLETSLPQGTVCRNPAACSEQHGTQRSACIKAQCSPSCCCCSSAPRLQSALGAFSIGFVWKDEVSAVLLKQKQILSVFAVMNDIITTMFNKKFMEELFKPQELYSKKALRTVYDRLAHASIMRLNQASMDKVKLGSVQCSLCCLQVTVLGSTL